MGLGDFKFSAHEERKGKKQRKERRRRKEGQNERTFLNVYLPLKSHRAAPVSPGLAKH